MPMKNVSSSTIDSNLVKLSRAEERVVHAQMTKEMLQSNAQWRYGLGKDVGHCGRVSTHCDQCLASEKWQMTSRLDGRLSDISAGRRQKKSSTCDYKFMLRWYADNLFLHDVVLWGASLACFDAEPREGLLARCGVERNVVVRCATGKLERTLELERSDAGG